MESMAYQMPLALALSRTAAAAKSLQSCPTLCDPIDGSPPGSAVPGILQARTLEWVAISFSNAWKWKGKVKSLSHVRFLATPWTAAYQTPPSMGFSRQEYWSGVPLPSPWAGQGFRNMYKTWAPVWWEMDIICCLPTYSSLRMCYNVLGLFAWSKDGCSTSSSLTWDTFSEVLK